MAPSPLCRALAAAQSRTGMSYAQIARAIDSSEERVTAICTGGATPTDAEFGQLAAALGIADVSHTGVHATA